jgi:hypothetical protein
MTCKLPATRQLFTASPPLLAESSLSIVRVSHAGDVLLVPRLVTSRSRAPVRETEGKLCNTSAGLQGNARARTVPKIAANLPAGVHQEMGGPNVMDATLLGTGLRTSFLWPSFSQADLCRGLYPLAARLIQQSARSYGFRRR